MGTFVTNKGKEEAQPSSLGHRINCRVLSQLRESPVEDGLGLYHLEDA